MTPKELFSVVVRVIGLGLLFMALEQLFVAITSVLFGGSRNVADFAIVGTLKLIIGVWFLRGAPALVSFAFPERAA